jgi:hypothetical protein
VIRKNLGVDGALALQPTFLYTPRQFWRHECVTHGRRLYTMFGTWMSRGDRSRPAGPPTVSSLPVPDRSPLERLNAARRSEALEQLDRLIAIARPIFDEWTKRHDRGAGRVNFAKALSAAGIEVPRRRIVDVLKVLTRRDS